MKTKTTVATRANRTGRTLLGGFVTAAATAALLIAATTAYAGGPGSSGNAVTFEAIPGSKLKRVILTPKAIERLGIEIGTIGEKRIVRKQMVGGTISHPLRIKSERRMARSSFGGFARAAAQPVARSSAIDIASLAAGAWVRVVLSQGEWDRVASDKAARILPLATRADLPKEVWAAPSEIPPLHDVKRTMLTVYYVVPGKDHGLKVNDRMRVELTLEGDNQKRKVMPYSALYYDGKGVPWVYVASRARTFERRRVEIDRIVGDTVVLKSGPPIGTPVASTGAAMLYGAEVIFKK